MVAFGCFYVKMGQLTFILVNFLETAKNNFRKMNGFRVFWAKVDKNEWVLGKSEIRKKCCHEGTKKSCEL